MLFLIKKLFCNSSTKHKINFESLPSAKVVDAILSSAVVIDIHHPSQHGLTMRTIEAVGLNKKIITTNADIKKYNFMIRKMCMSINLVTVNYLMFFCQRQQLILRIVRCIHSNVGLKII